eukprot:7386436-Prymnesium_polylepis.1
MVPRGVRAIVARFHYVLPPMRQGCSTCRILLALALPVAAIDDVADAGSGEQPLAPPTSPPPPPAPPFCQEGYPPERCSSIWGICGNPASNRKLAIDDKSQICIGFDSSPDGGATQKAVFQVKVDAYSRLRVSAREPARRPPPQTLSPRPRPAQARVHTRGLRGLVWVAWLQVSWEARARTAAYAAPLAAWRAPRPRALASAASAQMQHSRGRASARNPTRTRAVTRPPVSHAHPCVGAVWPTFATANWSDVAQYSYMWLGAEGHRTIGQTRGIVTAVGADGSFNCTHAAGGSDAAAASDCDSAAVGCACYGWANQSKPTLTAAHGGAKLIAGLTAIIHVAEGAVTHVMWDSGCNLCQGRNDGSMTCHPDQSRAVVRPRGAHARRHGARACDRGTRLAANTRAYTPHARHTHTRT